MSHWNRWLTSHPAWTRLLTAVLLLLAVVGCGSDEVASVELSDEPPWGLDTVELPTDSSTLADVFASMPTSVDGVPIDEEFATPENIQYAEGEERYLLIRAISSEDIEAFTGGEMSNVQDFVAVSAESGEYEAVEASQLDESQNLVYVAFSAIGDGELMYGTLWAEVDGNWVFSAAADTADARTGLIHSFIEACNAAN